MNLRPATLRCPLAVPIRVLAWTLCALLSCAVLPACGQEKQCPVACPAFSVSIKNATTLAAVCDATVLEMLPDVGTKMLPVYRSQTPMGPITDAACPYATIGLTPGESATVTIPAPGFKSTMVTLAYGAMTYGGCCPGFSLDFARCGELRAET